MEARPESAEVASCPSCNHPSVVGRIGVQWSVSAHSGVCGVRKRSQWRSRKTTVQIWWGAVDTKSLELTVQHCGGQVSGATMHAVQCYAGKGNPADGTWQAPTNACVPHHTNHPLILPREKVTNTESEWSLIRHDRRVSESAARVRECGPHRKPAG
jgi:hypothetical protein